MEWQRQIDQKFIDDVRSAFRGQEIALAKYASAATAFNTALAANLPTRALRESEMAQQQHWAEAFFYGQLLSTAEDVAKEVQSPVYEVADCGVRPEELALDTPQPASFKVADCPAGFEDSKVGLSFGVFSASMTCKGFEVEAKTPTWLGLFAKLQDTAGGDTTLTFGIQAEGKLGGAGVSGGVGASEGVYLKWDRGGSLQDVGLRIAASVGGELSGGAKVGGVSGTGSHETKAEFEVEFGVASAVEYWTSDRYDSSREDDEDLTCFPEDFTRSGAG